jgi:hypothetical protein
MKPSTSRTATGSFMPDSPSSVRASLRSSVELRSRPKIAAPSVAETIEPSSSPSSMVRSKSHAAANPVTTAVARVPATASPIEGRSTGRISRKPAVSPPSNRISDRAMTPIPRASS